MTAPVTPLRDPDNANIWVDAFVYASAASARPAVSTDADTALGVDWELPVGILDGKDGFDDDRKWAEKESFGWGIGLIKVSHSHFAMTRSFTALEDNEATRAMLWPGSSATSIVVPRPTSLWLCWEKISDLGKVSRLYSTKKAQVWCAKIKSTEDDITSYPFECKIFADGNNELFTQQLSTP